MESNGVAMLHKNICLHNAIRTADPLQKLNFMVSKYHLYSPQLFPWITVPLVQFKGILRVYFTSDQHLQEAVHA